MSDDAHRLNPLPALIFSSRWLQLPLYLGLIVAQGVYVFLFLKELSHLVTDIRILDEQEVMLLVLGLIDVVMISNLLMMVIVGGYETFISRMRLERHPDQPEWLSHVNASVLKVKLAMAIIGISSIHLLKTFIDEPLSERAAEADLREAHSAGGPICRIECQQPPQEHAQGRDTACLAPEPCAALVPTAPRSRRRQQHPPEEDDDPEPERTRTKPACSASAC